MERITFNGKTYVRREGEISVQFERRRAGKRAKRIERQLHPGPYRELIAARFDSQNVPLDDMRVGDDIYFLSATRWANRLVWRKVRGFLPSGLPTVRYGWSEFIVRLHEIKRVRRNRKG
jgi:hypothetical protein